MKQRLSLQEQFAPNLICFGCGPANRLGLQLKSYVADISADETADDGLTDDANQSATHGKVIATFMPSTHHQAFEGIVNGGIISVLLDCHLNWTAAWHLMKKNGLTTPPCCVTAKYEVTFVAPTPAGVPLYLEAWVVESSERKAVVTGTLAPLMTANVASGSSVCIPELSVSAHGWGTFVAVKPGHPAFHRW